jgi:hypothetical protein
MPSLSLDKADIKDARAIASVNGGKYNGEILFLHEQTPTAKPQTKEIPANTVVYKTEMKGMKPAERTKTFARLEEAAKKGVHSEHLVGESTETKKLYERLLTDMSSDKKVGLDDDGLFELLPSPNPEKREVWYIAGASGSGKSYIARGLAFYYKKLFPDRQVYLVSKLDEDSTLDALPFLKRILVQSFVDDYPDLEEFKDCMVIFDDYDTLTGDAEKVITKIVDDLAIMGRHTNTTILCLSHYLTNYKKTRLLLNEATHIVVYPLSTSYHALRYLIKNYVGVDEEDLKRQRKLGSRWLMYSKGFPQYMISQKNAELLHQ